MRRDSNDKEWKKTKETVRDRDKGDRILRIVSMAEAKELQRHGAFNMGLDPAHILPVGQFPQLCYEPNDIVMLNHYSHSNLDDCRHPINGKSISKESRDAWWVKILKANKEQYKFFVDNDLLKYLEC